MFYDNEIIKLKIKIAFLFIIAFIIIPFSLNAADRASLSGFVKDSITKETLIGAKILVKDTKLGAFTNKSGYFSISDIPPGKREIVVSFLGYDKLTRTVQFKAGESIRIDFEPVSRVISTQEIIIEAEREVEKRQIEVSKVNVPINIIKDIRIGGESDVFRTLQYLPGVLTSSQISGGLYVRGGSPDQNLVLLDGSTVYNPTHLFGFISAFNTDAIKDVELIKGGYEAQYGGRLSSVLNITQKDGDRSKVQGVASLGVISSRLSVEGPSPFGSGSWFIGGRRTYFELIKAAIKDDPETPLPDFNFYDLNAKWTQDIGASDKVSLSGFLSRDNLLYSSFGLDMDLSVGNKLGALKWTHIFADKLFATMNLSYSKYFNNFAGDQSGYEFLINNSISDYTAKISLEWFTSDILTHKFGYEVTKYNFAYLQDFTGSTDSTKTGSGAGNINLDVEDLAQSFYTQVHYSPGELFSFQAGFRASYWSSSKSLALDPRLAVRYQLFENVAIKGAWGMYSQNLRLASQPDFSFFDTWLPTDSTLKVSKAVHYIFSIETKPWDGYDLNFDFYYKRLSNVSELNPLALQAKTAKDVFYIGSAKSYGFEAFLQKKFGAFTGWAGYGLGYIYATFDSINHGTEFRPKYDRRHDIKLVGQYTFDETWDCGATFTFQTGQSYTGALSRVQSFLDHQSNGYGKIVPSQRYGLRLPPSHQLNVNVGYSFKMFGLVSKAVLDVYNVYNRRDIWFRYYNTRESNTKVEDVLLIPILPTLSLEVKF